MGFDEEDYESIIEGNFVSRGDNHYFFTRDNLIKMAGNSIAVNVLMEVFRQIKQIEIDIFNDRMNLQNEL